MEGKTTFWDLLGEKSIRIPEIQRDYAQGRENAKDIRNNFLDSIKKSLDSKGKIDLDLNFVYGTVKGDLFTPIDGQQRLTTLYLLHTYILLALKKRMDKRPDVRIKNFSYATRRSASNFCKNLSEMPLVLGDSNSLSNVDRISDIITNNNWFSSSWKNDPTVKSMLNMLDSIHSMFKNSNLSEYYDILTGNSEYDCPLYFYFLDLGEYNLEDSIYIKLNARGKDLTCYENFKAKLSKYISDEIKSPKDDYIAKLDGEWSDVFWTFRDPETRLYDDKIMSFFMNFMINEYAAYMKSVGRDAVRTELKEIIGYNQLEFINRFQDYNEKWNGQRVADSFVRIFDLFDTITDGKQQIFFAPDNQYFDEGKLFKYIIENNDTEKSDNKSGISYTTRIQADAYFGFILNNKEHITEKEEFSKHLTEWMRVIATLSRETNYNGSDDYSRAISKGVRNMLPHSYDILDYLAGISDYSGYGFDSDCFEEECIKAKLMLRDAEWRELILNAERNKYFNGQIGFLLEAANLISQHENGLIENWQFEDDRTFKDKFKKYLNVYGSIFGEFSFGSKGETYVGINRQFANLLRRALLCKGDYHLNESSNSSFLVDFDRDIGWKRMLRIQSNDKQGVYRIRRNYLLALIDDPLFDINNISSGLINICNRDSTNITDWRKYFITVPEIMNALHDYSSIKPKDRFFRTEGDNIFLMGSTRLYGFNDEYYSFALYCLINNLDKYKMEDYVQAKGWEDIPYQIKAKNMSTQETLTIKYARSNKTFTITFNNGLTQVYSSIEDVLHAIK